MLKRIGAEESGEFKAVASGTLPSGKPVVINADGTVSVVAETSVSAGVGSAVVFNNNSSGAGSPYIVTGYDSNAQKVIIAYRDDGNSNSGTAIVGTVSGTSISFGSSTAFNSADFDNASIAFDSTNNKIVIVYADGNNNYYGTAIVGTVSGTSISFGSPVVYNSNLSTYNSAVFDSNAGKIVVGFRNQTGSNLGKAIVGTVSGTSISFGSAVTFNNASTQDVAAVYDSANNKVVIAFRDLGDSNKGKAIVGTVSGTSISFGSEATFSTNNSFRNIITFDSSNNKVIIVYSDITNSYYGTAIVGTVSGTSISFGTAVVYHSGSSYRHSISYDSNAQKSAIFYRDSGNSDYGTAIVGTVSITSISFGSPILFESAAIDYISSSYDENSQKIVTGYRDTGNSNRGTAIVFQNASTSTNLTSENYIGMSKGGAVADTKGATVDIIGAVNDEQSGLTPGQQYFVQTDGTIGTTAATPSVLAGTAISATELLVKT